MTSKHAHYPFKYQTEECMEQVDIPGFSDHVPASYFWYPLESLRNIRNYVYSSKATEAAKARGATSRIEDLHHEDLRWVRGEVEFSNECAMPDDINGPQREANLTKVNGRIESIGLTLGILSYAISHQVDGQQIVILDLAWHTRHRDVKAEPVAHLLNEGFKRSAIGSLQGAT